MEYIELNDGISSRRINVPGLIHPIRIDVTGEDSLRIVVPTGVTVDRQLDPSGTLATESTGGDRNRVKQPEKAI